VDARAFDGERKKNVGIAQRIVIEKVQGVGLKLPKSNVQPWKGIASAKFALLVAFSMKRKKTGAGIGKKFVGKWL